MTTRTEPQTTETCETEPKRIILLSDGTGNAAAKVWRSNVWRLFEALDLTKPSQVAIYDDGVGTASFRPLALAGGALGWGLKRNVIDLYAFLCRNYAKDAKIFGFGFSRGAFTIRVVIGLVVNQGVISTAKATSEADLQRLARAAYRRYRAEKFHSIVHIEGPFRWLRDRLVSVKDRLLGRKPYDKTKNIQLESIRFLGLWDTVAAYGLPIDEMTRGVSQWIWPLELPDRTLSSKVKRACHALSLDDERTTFHPVLWTEKDEAAPPVREDGYRHVEDERISQVWFAGVHANVGGGYPDDRLAHVPLTWMMEQAAACGLEFKKAPAHDPDAMRRALSTSDKDGRLYDSRKGLAGYYRYGPRKIADLCQPHYTPVVAWLARLLRVSEASIAQRFAKNDVVQIVEPKIHTSVIERMKNGAHSYAPIGFPPVYAVVDDKGRIRHGKTNPYEAPDDAKVRSQVQERVWNLVWCRRVLYFATLGASGHLALFPLLYRTDREAEYSSPVPLVSQSVRVAGGLLPGFLQGWIDAFAANPVAFAVSVTVVTALMLAGVFLGARITDAMRGLWCNVLDPGSNPFPAAPRDAVFRLRTADAYRSLVWAMKRWVLPFASAALILLLGGVAINRLALSVTDGLGLPCREDEEAPGLAVGEVRELEGPNGFDTGNPCWPTGISLDRRGRYEVTLTVETPWRDKGIQAGVTGFEVGQLESVGERIKMFAAVPLRRDLTEPWFRPIARIGAQGFDEHPLDPEARGSAPKPSDTEITTVIRPRRSGELFLYVNEAVLVAPGLVPSFYRNNEGTATLKVKRVR
jgi:uncharacterized protein (DUF2235 family)